MSPNPIDIIINIPEIQIAFGAVLTHRQLLDTLLVSKEWHAALLPAYWHTLDIGALAKNPSTEQLERAGHLIRSLILRQYTALDIYVPYCTLLDSLTIETFDVPVSVLRQHWPILVQFLHQNSLVCVNLNIRNRIQLTTILEAFEKAPHHWSRLQRLSFQCSFPINTHFILDLLKACPSLHYLTVHSRFRIEVAPAEEYFVDDARANLVFPNLRRVNVDGNYEEDMYLNFLLPVWQRASRLEFCWACIRGQPTDLARVLALDALIRHHPVRRHHIRYFRLIAGLEPPSAISSTTATATATSETTNPDWLDSAVADLIGSAVAPATLKYLHFRQCPVGTLTTQALTTYHASSLVSLDMEGGAGSRGPSATHTWALRSATIAIILTTCPNLKTLRLLRGQIQSPDQGLCALDARNAVKKPWVCLGLEVLVLCINGFCRQQPFVHDQQATAGNETSARNEKHGEPSSQDGGMSEDNDANTMEHFDSEEHREQCQELQRLVFRQLGQLTHLHALVLDGQGMDSTAGYNFTSGRKYGGLHDQLDCLDFRLSSNGGPGGLECLARLSRLQRLSVCRLKHNIGVDEVSWMVSYWPHFKRVRGLAHAHNGNNSTMPEYVSEHYPQLILEH